MAEKKQEDAKASRQEKALIKQVDALEKELAALKSIRRQMASDLKAMEKRCEKLSSERDDLAKSNAKLKERNAKAIRDEKDLAKQASALEKEIARLSSGGKDSNLKAMEKRCEKLSSERNDLAKSNAKLKERNAKAIRDGKDLAKQVSALEKEIARLSSGGKDSNLKAMEKRCEKLSSERDVLAEQLDSLKELPKKLNHLRKYVNDIEKDRKKLQLQIAVLEERTGDNKSGKGRRNGGEDGGLLTKIAQLERENTYLRESLTRQQEKLACLDAGSVEAAISQPAGLSDIDKRLEQANALFERGLTDKSEEIFNEILKNAPENFDANLGLAYCYYTKSYYSRALEIANRLRQDYPENARALKLIGLAEWRRGRLVEAGDALKQALKSEPDSAHLHNYLAVICHALGDYETARHEFLRAIELDGQLVEAYFSLAVLLTSPEKLDLKAAKEYYEKAIQLGRRRNEDLEKILYR